MIHVNAAGRAKNETMKIDRVTTPTSWTMSRVPTIACPKKEAYPIVVVNIYNGEPSVAKLYPASTVNRRRLMVVASKNPRIAPTSRLLCVVSFAPTVQAVKRKAVAITFAFAKWTTSATPGTYCSSIA